ncbi:MAG: bifunctional DNA-formamidopyrimidine glycosylase/DNA-(apurinic or apyrimidinic site) lyase [Nanoarchaeota archaeon]|mgnify:CR=1 FL=1
MPELPEVETIVRQLQRSIQGKTIKAVEIRDRKVVDKTIRQVIPSTIQRISRRGKYILIYLDNNQGHHNVLLTHLRMSGHFQYQEKKWKQKEQRERKDPNKYVAATFHFQDGTTLTFNEIRRFGRMVAVPARMIPTMLSSLGPEPLDCSYSQFHELLQKKRRANIKSTLLDQRVLVGLGNIYAQEALYRAGIAPQRTVETLTEREIKKLHQSIQSTLSLAIKQGGTTIENYTSLEGSGRFQRFLAVYGKERCPRKHPTEKVKIGGRGTWWCKKCQG